jgi:molecular chaperone DnaJ
MTITFQEAAFGVKKQISITRLETCEACSGSGAKKGSQVKTCPTCHGTGQVRTVQNTILGQMATSRVCDACRGEGTIISQPCEAAAPGRVRKRANRFNISAVLTTGDYDAARSGEQGKRAAQRATF